MHASPATLIALASVRPEGQHQGIIERATVVDVSPHEGLFLSPEELRQGGRLAQLPQPPDLSPDRVHWRAFREEDSHRPGISSTSAGVVIIGVTRIIIQFAERP